MVNFEEIYGVVKYRTELGEGGIGAYTQPPVFPLKGRFWRAAGCRPYAV